MSKKNEVSKAKATSLAKYLLGKPVFIDKYDYNGFCFEVGQVTIFIHEWTTYGSTYSFKEFNLNGERYEQRVYEVSWKIGGESVTRFYTMDSFDLIYHEWKPDEVY